MNLPLHFGLLGAIEAGLIAILAGLLAYGLWQRLLRARDGAVGPAIGWAGLTSVIVAAGIDGWNLFYLAVMRMESPLYARIALQGIHDPGSLGTRVVFEILGTLLGVLLGWYWFSARLRVGGDAG